MQINTKKMKNDLLVYSNLIEEYETLYINYYNTASYFSFLWEDTKSKKFFDKVLLEKKDCLIMMEEFLELRKTYEYVLNKCIGIGEVISIDLKKEDVILDNFDRYINKARNILSLFNEINVYDKKYQIIWGQRKKMEKIIEKMQENRYIIKNLFIKMKDIEQKLNNKLKNFDIILIKENDISRMV